MRTFHDSLKTKSWDIVPTPLDHLSPGIWLKSFGSVFCRYQMTFEFISHFLLSNAQIHSWYLYAFYSLPPVGTRDIYLHEDSDLPWNPCRKPYYVVDHKSNTSGTQVSKNLQRCICFSLRLDSFSDLEC